MRYQLTNVGRSRFTGIVEVANDYQLMKEIKKHCGSRFIDLDWFAEKDADGKLDFTGVVFAGFHKIGEIKLLGEKEMAKSKSPKKEAKKPKKNKGKGKSKSKKNSDDETATTDIADPPKPVEPPPAPLPTEPPPAPEETPSVELPNEHQQEPGEPPNM